jgi:hypothetical protein
VGDAVALKRRDRAVVHSRGNRHGDGLLALREDADEVRIDVEGLPNETELLLGELEGVLTKMGCWGV